LTTRDFDLSHPLGAEANKLTETNKVINAFLKDKLSAIDPAANLSKDQAAAAKVSAAFQAVADALKGLP
jgi:hypothetical protein